MRVTPEEQVREQYDSLIKNAPIGIQPKVGGPGSFTALPRLRSALQLFTRGVGSVGARLDSWVNDVTGFGTARDKTTYGYALPDRRLTDPELSAVYHSDDMAARMVDIYPQEMLREPFMVSTGDPKADASVSDKFDALSVRSAYMDGVRWGRCYGGAAVLIGADDGQDASLPLKPERADDVDYLYVLDRRYLWPLRWYDQPGKKGQVETYLVSTIGGTSFETAEVHESRLVLFGGAPTGIREKIQYWSWDLSVLQRAYAILRMFNNGWSAVETLLIDGTQSVFKMGGLEAILASPGGGAAELQARIQAMDLYRSVMRAIVVDADNQETFERQTVSFEQIPQTLDKLMLRLSATVETPVTILMGQSPAGMNATGDSDFRWFYDRVRSKQNTDLAPRIRRLAEVWLQTRAGRASVKVDPRALKVTFVPLWTETPLAKAQREQAIATRDATYITAQVLSPDEVAVHRFGHPDGFDREIVLTKEGLDARKAAMAVDHEAMTKDPADDAAAQGGAPEIGAPAPAGDEAKRVEIPLAPTDIATVVTVNEARASLDLPPFKGPDGQLTMTAFKAAHASDLAAAAQAEAGTDPSEPEPPPAPNPFGGPPGAPFGGDGGGAPAGGPPVGVRPGEHPDPGGDPTNDPADEEQKLDADVRTFTLVRDVDESGVSGTGDVADGVCFRDGSVAMRWRTATAATTLFGSMDDVLKVHGHGGLTRVVWHDTPAGRLDAAATSFDRIDAKAADPAAEADKAKKAQDKAAKKAAGEAKEKSKAAWAATHEAQQAEKSGDKAKASAANAKAAAAHKEAKSAWEDAANTARPGSGQFLSASAVVQDHAHHASKHEAAAHASGKGGSGGGGGGQDRDDQGRFA